MKVNILQNTISVFTLTFLFLTANALASKPDSLVKKGYKFRYQPNEAFGFGERLDYKVGYKFITAGRGYFKIMPKPVLVKGRKCYDIRFEVKSLKSLEWIYKVRDGYRTVLDVGGIFPWQFEQHIREGKYRFDFTAKFDQINHTATTPDSTYETPEYVHDIVSALYFARTLDLRRAKKDSIIELKNFYSDSTYQLGIKIRGRQTIEVEAGTFKCIVVEPMVVKGGLFKNEGKIVVWLSDDERKIPIKVATKIVIGYVGAELTSYKGLRGPVKAHIKEDD